MERIFKVLDGYKAYWSMLSFGGLDFGLLDMDREWLLLQELNWLVFLDIIFLRIGCTTIIDRKTMYYRYYCANGVSDIGMLVFTGNELGVLDFYSWFFNGLVFIGKHRKWICNFYFGAPKLCKERFIVGNLSCFFCNHSSHFFIIG